MILGGHLPGFPKNQWVLPFGGNPETVFLGKGCDFNWCMLFFVHGLQIFVHLSFFCGMHTNFDVSRFATFVSAVTMSWKGCRFWTDRGSISKHQPWLSTVLHHTQPSFSLSGRSPIIPSGPHNKSNGTSLSRERQPTFERTWVGVVFFRVYITDYASNLLDPKNEGTITKYDQLWNPLLAPTMFKQLFVASGWRGTFGNPRPQHHRLSDSWRSNGLLYYTDELKVKNMIFWYFNTFQSYIDLPVLLKSHGNEAARLHHLMSCSCVLDASFILLGVPKWMLKRSTSKSLHGHGVARSTCRVGGNHQFWVRLLSIMEPWDSIILKPYRHISEPTTTSDLLLASIPNSRCWDFHTSK